VHLTGDLPSGVSVLNGAGPFTWQYRECPQKRTGAGVHGDTCTFRPWPRFPVQTHSWSIHSTTEVK
jgi:hypothetical protein